MASVEKIKTRILQIAAKPKNVTLGDIEWVMNQLKDFGKVDESGNVHRKVWCFDGALLVFVSTTKEVSNLNRRMLKNS